MLRAIKLDFDWSYFLPPKQDYSVHKGSCLTHQTKELTDIHEEYGLGETYTFNNTVIQQLWYTDKEVDYKERSVKLAEDVRVSAEVLAEVRKKKQILLEAISKL